MREFKFPRSSDHDKWLDARNKIEGIIRPNRKLSANDIENLRLNSYEWETIIPHLDDGALIKTAGLYLHNVSLDQSRPYRSYNEAVLGMIAPLLVERLKDRLGNENGNF